jgi:hypothetical protein
MRNVIDELPKEQRPQAMNLMRAAWRVHNADEGVKRLEQLARFLEQEHESAARSLREGMAEMFTVQRLQLPPALYKCLGTTNVIESLKAACKKELVTSRAGAMPAWSNPGPHRLGYSLKSTSERWSAIEISGLLPLPSEENTNPTLPPRRSRNMKLSRPDLQLSSGHPRCNRLTASWMIRSSAAY